MWRLELEGFDPLHFDDSARAREAFRHYGRFTAARLSLVVASSDGAGRFFTAFDAPGEPAASAPSDAPNLPPRMSLRAVFARASIVHRPAVPQPATPRRSMTPRSRSEIQ